MHQTALELGSKCGIAYEYRYLRNVRTPTSVAAAVGWAVDKATNADLQHKLDKAELLPPEQVLEIARDAIVEQFSNQDVETTYEDREDGAALDRDSAIDASTDLAGFGHRNLAPTIFKDLPAEQCSVQKRFVLDVPNLDILGAPVQLVGTMDIVQGTRSIDDLKTTGKSPRSTMADESMQLTTYALADAVLRGQQGKLAAPVEKVALHYLVRTPKKHDLKLVHLESTRRTEQFSPVLARLEALSRAINSGVFVPASPNDWYCSRKYCPYWEICPYALRPVSVVMSGGQQWQVSP
jgi:hypothetical protein